MCVEHVFGIGRNQPRFNPKAHAFGGEHLDADIAFHFFRTGFGHIEVAAVARCQAHIATRQFVNHRGAETLDVGADGLQHVGRRFDVVGIGAFRVFAQIVERNGEHLAGCVPQGDAASFELIGVFRLEEQIPTVFGQGAAERFFAFGGDRQSVDAGEIGHGVFIARVGALEHF